MSSQITVIGVCLWFFTAVTAADKELCQRLYLKGLDEENVAFVQLGGKLMFWFFLFFFVFCFFFFTGETQLERKPFF